MSRYQEPGQELLKTPLVAATATTVRAPGAAPVPPQPPNQTNRPPETFTNRLSDRPDIDRLGVFEYRYTRVGPPLALSPSRETADEQGL